MMKYLCGVGDWDCVGVSLGICLNPVQTLSNSAVRNNKNILFPRQLEYCRHRYIWSLGPKQVLFKDITFLLLLF